MKNERWRWKRTGLLVSTFDGGKISRENWAPRGGGAKKGYKVLQKKRKIIARKIASFWTGLWTLFVALSSFEFMMFCIATLSILEQRHFAFNDYCTHGRTPLYMFLRVRCNFFRDSSEPEASLATFSVVYFPGVTLRQILYNCSITSTPKKPTFQTNNQTWVTRVIIYSFFVVVVVSNILLSNWINQLLTLFIPNYLYFYEKIFCLWWFLVCLFLIENCNSTNFSTADLNVRKFCLEETVAKEVIFWIVFYKKCNLIEEYNLCCFLYLQIRKIPIF